MYPRLRPLCKGFSSHNNKKPQNPTQNGVPVAQNMATMDLSLPVEARVMEFTFKLVKIMINNIP